MPYYSAPAASPPPTAATLIDTDRGPVPVEALRAGDRVRTKDRGLRPLRWTGARRLDAAALAAEPELRPVRIRAGALGAGRPTRDLVVSPQHRVLLDDWRCELLFGETDMLAPAGSLLNDSDIHIDRGGPAVTYCHFLFDRPEIVYANGAESESFHPAGGLEALDRAQRAELLRLFPGLAVDPQAFGPPARRVLGAAEVEVLRAI